MRLRLVLVALIGVVPIALIVQWSDLVVGGTMMAGPFPPLAASLQWALLLLFAVAARRLRGAEPLTRAELLAILAVWIAANMVVGRGLLHPLLASIVGPAYYAKSGAMALAVPRYLPEWLAITDRAAARGFFEGHGEAVPWHFWRAPLFTWAMFVVPLLLANTCLCLLLERVWVRHEKLAFPLVALPIEALHGLSERQQPLERSRMLLAGLCVPILLHGFGAAHAYLPQIPCIPFYNDVSSYVTAAPWTALRPLYANIYPLLIGLTFLAPTDISLSVWFFLLLNKLEMVAAGAAGWNDGTAGGGSAPSPPYLEEQSGGAYIVLFVMLMWGARRHLAAAVRAALTPRRPGVGASDEDESAYRPAVFGLALGAIWILWWSVRSGLPFWLACLFFGFYGMVAVVLGRLMAEGGVAWILAPILPDKLITGISGSAALTPPVITRLTLYVQHLRDTRQLIGPALMQTGKLRDEAGVRPAPFYLLTLAGMALALTVGCVAALQILYGHGALSLAPNSDGLLMSASVIPLSGVNQAASRLLRAAPPSSGGLAGLLVGAGITLALCVLRLRLSWWPLHPLGYALTGTLQVGYANKMLCSIVLGWGFKSLAMRYGGAGGYRRVQIVALGLILGDLLMGAVLKILDAVLGPSGYGIF